MDDDIALTFDPNSFLKGFEAIIDKITESHKKIMNFCAQGFEAINDKITESHKKIMNFGAQGSKSVQNVQFSAIGLVKSLAPIGAAFASIRGLMRQIPEIGRTFSIAGDIIGRNLLWPLRKELVPLLQKLLDWVRDNRAMFVRWGNIIANVFRIIKSLVVGVWNFLKKMWESFSSSLKRVFGSTINSMSELVNIVLFKIASVIEFIMIAIEPIAEFIGKIFAVMAQSGIAFIKGLSVSMQNFLPVLGEIWEGLKDIADALGLSGANGNTLIKVFRTLGNVVGSVLMPIFRAFGTIIDTIALSVRNLRLVVAQFQAWRKDDNKEFMRLEFEKRKLVDEFEKKQKKRWGQQVEDWKRSGRDIQKTWTENEDKNKQVINNTRRVINNKNSKRNNNVINQRVTITNNINGAKNPNEIQKDINKGVRDALNEQRFRTGGR